MTALPSTEDLARLAKAIPEGPWLSVQNHPTNACANVLQDADWLIGIATLYGNHDDVPHPPEGEPWGDMPVRDATAEAIALLPDLLREVLDRRAAEAGMRALLRAGCDLLADEYDNIKASITMPDGSLSDNPLDAWAVKKVEAIALDVERRILAALRALKGGEANG